MTAASTIDPQPTTCLKAPVNKTESLTCSLSTLLCNQPPAYQVLQQEGDESLCLEVADDDSSEHGWVSEALVEVVAGSKVVHLAEI